MYNFSNSKFESSNQSAVDYNVKDEFTANENINSCLL